MPNPDLPLEYIHNPPQDTATPRTGAVFVLHGRGADEQDLLPVTEYFPDDLHVISFRAPTQLGPGYTWYGLDTSDGLHNSQPQPDDFETALTLVEDSIDEAITAFDIDPDAVGVLGFSQGAIMALTLLLESPDRFAWVVALHGYLPASHTDRAPDGLTDKPVFVAAGETDQLIPPERAHAAADRLTELGCAVTADTYPTGHGIGQAELDDIVEFVTTHTA